MAKHPTGKRSLPKGVTTKRVNISLKRYHERLMLGAMQRSTLGTSEFFRTLMDQAVGARVPLLIGLTDGERSMIPAAPV